MQLARVLCQVWAPVLDGVPRYLFLDEPVSSLDIRHQLMIMDVARRFADSGGGVIAILHDLNLAAMYADTILAIRRGRVAGFGTPSEILTDALISDVFECPMRVGQLPTPGHALRPAPIRRSRQRHGPSQQGCLMTSVFKPALFACLAFCTPVLAQETAPKTALTLELNALQPAEAGCRVTFLATNALGAPLDRAAVEVAMFNTDGAIDRIVTLDFKSLAQGKTKVLQFELADLTCDTLGRLLVNDITACEGIGIVPTACLDNAGHHQPPRHRLRHLRTDHARDPGSRFFHAGAVLQADWVVKSVMIGLLVASVWCWAIIANRLAAYARARARNGPLRQGLRLRQAAIRFAPRL